MERKALLYFEINWYIQGQNQNRYFEYVPRHTRLRLPLWKLQQLFCLLGRVVILDLDDKIKEIPNYVVKDGDEI